ncbi:MAG TPA: DUF6056 family protein [Kofleriaceae bacterium]|nr:DUF6056 family protein [Kofleriaceae bacterium]
MTAGSRAARWATLGVLAAIAVVHGLACAWAPLAFEDWQHVLPHAGGLRMVGDWIDAALVRVPGAHAIGTPVATLALLVGVLTLAERRRIDPRRWTTVLGLAFVSATIWIALPATATMWFHRPYAAAQVWGGAIAVWLAVPYRCRTPLRHPAWSVVLCVAGVIAATSTRQFAIALVVGLAIAIARTPRPERRAWMWLGLAGVLAGTALSVVHAPWREAGKLFVRLDPSFAVVAPVLRDSGEVVTLLGLLVLGCLTAHALRPRGDLAALTDELARVAGDAAAWLAAVLGLSLALRVGPSANGPLLMPAVLALCVAAWPVARALVARPVPRAIVVGVVVLVHGLMWPTALRRAAALDDELTARLAAVARTPADQIARVAPYAHVLGDAWTVGDDWNDAALREALARDHFGVRGIDLAPAFPLYDASPDLALALAVDGATPAQVQAAAPPATWPRSIARARRELAGFARRLHAIAPAAVARLAIAAWSDVEAHPMPTLSRSRVDDTGHFVASLPPAIAARYPEVWAVRARGAEPLACDRGRCPMTLDRDERIVVVACDAERCGAADAWVPVL